MSEGIGLNGQGKMDFEDQLILDAIKARKNSYSPYSKFAVGAAVRVSAEETKIFTGCNIENASYGLTICAERTAIFSAVSQGFRGIEAIAIVAAGDMPYPCGACRQVLSEFAVSPQIPVYVVKIDEEGEILLREDYTLEELLPKGFTLSE